MLVSRGMCSSGSGTICVTYASTPRSARASAKACRASGALRERNWCTGMPRARAAAFTGSGFGPASGGHTTAAIVSPAASRPRSTSSAKAACPTRRMRIGGSGLQMPREELLEPRPRVLGRGLLVRGALVAEEAVLRAGVDDHLDCLPVTPGLGLELLDAVERDVRVLLAEEGEHGALELRRLLGREPAAVEGCARLDLVGELAGGEIGHAPAHAEARDPDPVGAHEGLLLEVRNGAPEVGDDLRVLERLHQRDRLGELVVADRATLSAAPVEIRRERNVALARDPARHVLDVVVQSERLLDDEHAGHAGAVLWPRQEGGHRADRRRHFDHLALHCGTPPGGVGAQPVAASVIGGALHRAMPWRGALSYR